MVIYIIIRFSGRLYNLKNEEFFQNLSIRNQQIPTIAMRYIYSRTFVIRHLRFLTSCDIRQTFKNNSAI